MKERINGFNYLKMIAASLLVFHHYQQVFNCNFVWINFYGGRIAFGYLVELFFTISGFLTLYSERGRTSVRGGQRLLHKLLRIYPMTCVSIAICLLFKICLSIYLADGTLSDLLTLKSLVANFGLLFAGYPFFEMMGINNPVWYVCILVQCYIIYYFVEVILNKINIKCALVRLCVYGSIIILAIITYRIHILNEASFRGFLSFFIGCSICILNLELKEASIINENNKIVISYVLLLLSILSCGVVVLGLNQRWVLQFFVFPLLVCGLVNLEVKDGKIIDKMGDISFEVYLFHYPLMVLVQLISAITGFAICHTYLTMVVFLLFSWVIGWIVWKYVDLPLRHKLKGT